GPSARRQPGSHEGAGSRRHAGIPQRGALLGAEPQSGEHLIGVFTETRDQGGRRRPGGRTQAYGKGRLLERPSRSPVEADDPAELAVDRVVEDPGDKRPPLVLNDELRGHVSRPERSLPGARIPGRENLFEDLVGWLALTAPEA